MRHYEIFPIVVHSLRREEKPLKTLALKVGFFEFIVAERKDSPPEKHLIHYGAKSVGILLLRVLPIIVLLVETQLDIANEDLWGSIGKGYAGYIVLIAKAVLLEHS